MAISPLSTSIEVRSKLVETIELDLVGPRNDHAYAHELLPQSPQRWYLSGYLVPQGADVLQKDIFHYLKDGIDDSFAPVR